MMKKILLLALIVASLQLTAQQMLVGSYNIRYKNWNDSVQGEHWQKRCQVICDQVNFMSPDIFGTQEVLWEQLQDMKNALDGYDYIGIGRDDGERGRGAAGGGEHAGRVGLSDRAGARVHRHGRSEAGRSLL